MHTLNAETAPAYPEVAASGECRSNPTNQQMREVETMMSHPTDTGLSLPINPDTGERYKLCIDAHCPNCGHPERNFDGDVFGCRKCDYTSRERNR